MSISRLPVASATALLALAAAASAQVKVEEQIVGPAEKTGACAISPRGVHVVSLVSKGSRFAVMTDGVEGPKFDQMLNTGGTPFTPSFGGQSEAPVAFSSDGEHCAYFARIGGEYIVVLDGKEVGRGKYAYPEESLTGLAFSPGGNRLWYQHRDTAGATALILDGKPDPRCGPGELPLFSPDGQRYAYLATKPGTSQQILIVDGKEAPYLATDLQFTADSKHLLGIQRLPDEARLLVDGQLGGRAHEIVSVNVPPVGNKVAVVYGTKPPGQGGDQFLVVGGKKVEASQCRQVGPVWFSPDGEHCAALCTTTAQAKYVVVDGVKGQDYADIREFRFTPDSSKAVYFGATPKLFLVFGDEEFDGFASASTPVFGGGGKRVGFIGTNESAKQFVVVDGVSKESPSASNLAFTPDGAHYAFVAGRGVTQSLFLDGIEQPGCALLEPIRLGGNGSCFVFSPDGKHIAYSGIDTKDPGQRGPACDGKLLAKSSIQTCRLPRFSPDSRHVWYALQTAQGLELYVDGEFAVRYAIEARFEVMPQNWQFGADGVLTFVTIADGAIKRYRVTPSAETSIDTLLAKAPN